MRPALALLLALAIVAPAAAAKPKPWMWTTATAAAKVNSVLEDAPTIYGSRAQYSSATCRGTGKAVARRFTAFACTVKTREGLSDAAKTRHAWIKVRPRGKGGACLSIRSLRSVPSACLTARGLVPFGEPTSERPTPEGQIQNAMTARFQPDSTIPWQGFTQLDCLGADGFYQCSFESAVSGSAIVMYRAAAVTVKFTALSCVGAFAGRPECSV